MQFLDALGDRPLIGDGAMGTLLYEMGIPLDRSFDALNVQRPDLVEEVHSRYVAAGAQFIETNTFGANRDRLATTGLEDRVVEINRAGVALARKAVGGRDVFVAGSIGPLRRVSNVPGRLKNSERNEIFKEQATALADAGADLLILETFNSLDHIRIAYEAARDACDLPIVAQMAFMERTGSFSGDEPVASLTELWRMGADVVGVNCGRGPRMVHQILEDFAPRTGHPLSSFFNAGAQDIVDGRYIYLRETGYLAQMAEKLVVELGVNLVGGCCGTTPDVIEAIAERLKDKKVRVRPRVALPKKARVEVGEEPIFPPCFLDRPDGEPSVIVELDPPRGMDFGPVLDGARRMAEVGVDLVSIAENPLASPRMGNVAMACLMKKHADVEPLVHFTGRDRNLIGLQSDIMGASALGLNYILCITGDPVPVVCEFEAKGVYDVTSFGLIKLVSGFNRGVNAAGASIKRPTRFGTGSAFNSNVKHLHVQVDRLKKKLALGAHYTLTQPCWDPARIVEIFEATRDLSVRLYMGVMPLCSERNAEFLHNEVPGMTVSEPVRARMKGLAGQEGREMGKRISEELLDVIAEHSSSVYIITPFNHYDSSAHLAEYFKERVRARARVGRAREGPR
ncbi:MAG: bifunctional homocysteine S-methyltransferase/methylenetetrahydrofolate reductase [Planctomycetota bacterium]|nr:bifunctional homocysteine S-methyltransferase/methylenetetrahydrofolate reductase [Planctomycetota bacterium]